MKKILLVLLILTLVGCGLLYLLQRKTDQTIQNVSSEVKTTETGSNLYTTTTDDIKNEENRNAQVDIDQVMKIFVSTI